MERKSRIKLCVVTTVSDTMYGFLVEQLVFLAKNEFDVTIICNTDDYLLQNCPKELTYIPVPMDRTVSVYSTIAGVVRLYAILKKHNFDCVQYATPKAAFITAIAARLARIPVRLYCQWGIRYVTMVGLPRWFFKRLEKITCCFSTHISPDSHGNLQFAVSEGLYSQAKASVVSFGSANGVNLKKFNYSQRSNWRDKVRAELGLDPRDFIFGWVGRVTRDKGVGELVKAFMKVIEQVPANPQLIMIGDIETGHNLTDDVMELIRLHPNIHYIGQQNNMERYYAAMDVLVAPSYREGFGMVAIEAQAMGVPVIVSDIPGPREAILEGKTGLLVPVREVDTLASAMMKLLAEQDYREVLGKEAVAFVSDRFEQQAFWQKVLEHRKLLLKGAQL